VADKLVKQTCGGVWRTAFDVESLAAIFQVLVALLTFERQRNLNFGGLLQALDKRDSPERRREVDVELDAVGAVGVIPSVLDKHKTRFESRGNEAYLILYPPVMALTIPEIMSSVRAMRSL
jgi:hypothetical protein